MSAITAITLTENAVNHVFNPLQAGKLSRWVTNEMNTPASEKSLELTFDEYNSQRSTDKITGKLVIPQELGDATNGYTVTDSGLFSFDVRIPKNLTSTNRSMLYDLAVALINHAIFQGYVENRDPAM